MLELHSPSKLRQSEATIFTMIHPTDPSELLEFASLINPSLFTPCLASVEGVLQSIPLSWELCSPLPGPRTVLFGGIHGNEWCGVHALRFLLQEFSEERLRLSSGSLVLAVGNAEALQRKVRYVGENMNRQFHKETAPKGTPYERRRVEELKAILRSNISLLLDLHATSAPSVPYAMIERPFLERARDFQFETVVTGWGELGDTSVTGDTQSFAETLGAWGITMENGQLSSPSSTDSAITTSLQVLARVGVEGCPTQAEHASVVYEMTEVYQLKRSSFRYQRPFSNLENLSRGELVGADEEEQYFAPKDYDAVMILPGNPAMLKPGDNLFHFGRRLIP
jgi:succinylglutamate desuccinylase